MTEIKRIYGVWSGNLKGVPENKSKCIEAVYNDTYVFGMISKQCKKKRGHGKDGLYCKQHANQFQKEQNHAK